MTRLYPETPIDWDTMAELPQQNGSVPPQGHWTLILPPSEHNISIKGTQGEGPTISESTLLQEFAWQARYNTSLHASLWMFFG